MTSRERFLAAAAGRPVDHLPVWIMRQAGRCLPAYREMRARHSFLEMCRTPELAARATLLPLEPLGVDGLVFFSDILIPLEGVGLPIRFEEDGPEVPVPLAPGSDLGPLDRFDPGSVGFVAEGLRLVRAAAPDHALLGFAGAPFTLAMYAIQGRGSRDFELGRAAMATHPDWFGEVMECLADMTIRYLSLQADAGADAVQLFDSWAGLVDAEDYRKFLLPSHQRIFRALKGRVTTILYTRGTAHVLPMLGEAGADVVSLDWRIPLLEADRVLPVGTAIQGSLDPCVLLAGEAVIRERAARNLAPLPSGRGRIANLGHGILPQTPVAAARTFVEVAHGAPGTLQRTLTGDQVT